MILLFLRQCTNIDNANVIFIAHYTQHLPRNKLFFINNSANIMFNPAHHFPNSTP